MRVALYARVSTADKGQDPRVQTLELQEYFQRRGWSVAGEYLDVGISGAKEKRPELDRLMIVERVRAGMRNARAKGKRIGRPPRTYLNLDARRSISKAYAKGSASLRQVAARFGTSIGTVQRCIQLYQKAST